MTSSNFIDYYMVLNLPRDFTDRELKEQYRRLSLLFHPDRHKNLLSKQKANDTFSHIQEAYNVLRDSEKRKCYDADLKMYENADQKQIIVYPRTSYLDGNIINERDNLLKKINQLNNSSIRGNMIVNIDMTELFQPNQDDYSILDRLQCTELRQVYIDQTSQIKLTDSNNLTLHAISKTDNGVGQGYFTIGFDHSFDDSFKNGVDFTLSDDLVKIGYHLSKYLSETIFTELYIIGSLQNEILSYNYNLTIKKMIDNTFSFSVILKEDIPPVISIILDKTWSKSFRSKLVTSVGNRLYTAGLSMSYLLSDYLKLSLTTQMANNNPTFLYSIGCQINETNYISGSISISQKFGVFLKIKYIRLNQTIQFPIYLADEILLPAIFFGTFGSLFIASGIHYAFKRTLKFWDQTKQLKKEKIARQKVESERMKQAQDAVSLLITNYRDSILKQKRINGLIITEAIYGNIDDQNSIFRFKEYSCIDIKIPLQCLVENSKLIIPKGSKNSIPGVYLPDTCKNPKLKIEYTFNGRKHMAIFSDDNVVALPKLSHELK